jgi:CelD/BcsL family acetyltransferase involved in cellulose biosynthesis
MPPTVSGRSNPLALLPQVRFCPVGSNVLAVSGTWEGYLKSLERRFRKELGRSWRVFAKNDTAAFRVIEDAGEAERVLAALEQQQRDRFGSGGGFLLDRPDIASFYRRLTAGGLPGGDVLLTALTYRNEVVAALLGLLSHPAYVMIRISTGARHWSHCSPGRLVIVETIRLLHGRGFRSFDFSVGDYAYKRRLGARRGLLFDFTVALTPFGMPAAAYDRAKGVVRSYQQLRRAAHSLAPDHASGPEEMI